MKSREGADAKPRYYFVLCAAGQWQEQFAEVVPSHQTALFRDFFISTLLGSVASQSFGVAQRFQHCDKGLLFWKGFRVCVRTSVSPSLAFI